MFVCFYPYGSTPVDILPLEKESEPGDEQEETETSAKRREREEGWRGERLRQTDRQTHTQRGRRESRRDTRMRIVERYSWGECNSKCNNSSVAVPVLYCMYKLRSTLCTTNSRALKFLLVVTRYTPSHVTHRAHTEHTQSRQVHHTQLPTTTYYHILLYSRAITS